MKKMAIMFLIVFLTGASRADADLIVALAINGTAAACATDNNSACGYGTQILDIDPTANVMSFGNLPINISGLLITGSSQQATFGGLQNILNTSSTQLENTTGAPMTVTLAVSATGFTPAAFEAFFSGSATWENAGGSSLAMEWYNDPLNRQGAETAFDRPGTLVGSCTDLITLPADSTACSGFAAVSDLNLFSMTLWTELVIMPGGTVVNRGQTLLKPVEAVPEPTAIAMFGIGLAFLARRRRTQSPISSR